LSEAIIQKDEMKVLQILNENPASFHELNSKGQSPLHLSTIWSRGIELLLTHGAEQLVNQADADGLLPITYALENRNYQTAKRLLDAGSALSSPSWKLWQEEILHTARRFGSYGPEIFKLAVEALQSRRAHLYKFAKNNLPTNVWNELNLPNDRILDKDAKRVQNTLKRLGIEVPKELRVQQIATTVYHTDSTYMLEPAEADLLFKAGFKDVHAADYMGITPLEACCVFGSKIGLKNGLKNDLKLLTWFISKCVDPCRLSRKFGRPQFVPGVSGYHMIGYSVGQQFADQWHFDQSFDSEENIWMFRKVVLQTFESFDEDSQILVCETIQSDSRDVCFCYCSNGGCSPTIIMQKSLSRKWAGINYPHFALYIRHAIAYWAENSTVKKQTGGFSRLAADIIRFGTFEFLGLTHTCCRTPDTVFHSHRRTIFTSPCTPHEVDEIHNEEIELIREHEKLVEMFLEVYEERGESLSSFLNGYWLTQMTRVFERSKRSMTDEELASIRRTGVVIRNGSDLDGLRAVEEERVWERDITSNEGNDAGHDELQEYDTHEESLEPEGNGSDDLARDASMIDEPTRRDESDISDCTAGESEASLVYWLLRQSVGSHNDGLLSDMDTVF
jgi:hypothetical protein